MRALMILTLFTALCAVVTAASNVPNVVLNNGVDMPIMSAGVWQLNETETEETVQLALSLGFNHIDTAWNYHNQDAVGRALKGLDRNSYFLTTKVPECTVYNNASECANRTQFMQDVLQFDLDQLGLDYVDLMLLHFPPKSPDGKKTVDCAAVQENWQAMEEFYAAKKARAIGVSNFCPSSFECLKSTMKVLPAVNQIEYHVGMGNNFLGIRSYCAELGVLVQAYSPLGDGTLELISGPLVTKIGSNYNKTGAQVSLRYLTQLTLGTVSGVPFATKSTSAQHLEEDLGIFNFTIDTDDMNLLRASESPAANYSFMCTE